MKNLTNEWVNQLMTLFILGVSEYSTNIKFIKSKSSIWCLQIIKYKLNLQCRIYPFSEL